jgi:hypothetical protein
MKSLICSAGMLCLSATPLCLRAQDANLEKEKVHSPKFEIGLQSGINKTLGDPFRSWGRYQPPNLNSINTGIFARYYLGKHFAIESGINISSAAINPTRRTDIFDFGSEQVRKTVNSRSFEIPLQLQYHLLGKDSKIRPYFGLGASYISHNYHITDRYYDATGSPTKNIEYHDNQRTLAVKFTQGITWQINKNWQLNQTIYYQRELAGHKNNIGLQLGVGYTIK